MPLAVCILDGGGCAPASDASSRFPKGQRQKSNNSVMIQASEVECWSWRGDAYARPNTLALLVLLA